MECECEFEKQQLIYTIVVPRPVTGRTGPPGGTLLFEAEGA